MTWSLIRLCRTTELFQESCDGVKKWGKSHRMIAHHCMGRQTRLWEAPVLWLQLPFCLDSSGRLGLPNGAVSSPSCTSTPTKTRPAGPEIGRDRSLPVCAQPGQGWQSWRDCCSQEFRHLPRCPPECPLFNQKQCDIPSPSRPHSFQGCRAPA